MIVDALRTAKPAEVPAMERELLAKGGEAVKPLIELLTARRGQDRIMALLSKLGPKAVAPLIALLPDAALRPGAARALAQAVGSSTADQAEELLDCMGRYPDVNHFCGMALVRGMGPKQARWIPRLDAALKSSDRDQRLYAALALKLIGLNAPGAREALMKVVSDPDPEVRQVARSLGLRPAPKPGAMKAAPAKPAPKGAKTQ